MAPMGTGMIRTRMATTMAPASRRPHHMSDGDDEDVGVEDDNNHPSHCHADVVDAALSWRRSQSRSHGLDPTGSVRQRLGSGSPAGSDMWSPDSASGGDVCEAGGWRGRLPVEAAWRRGRGRLGEERVTVEGEREAEVAEREAPWKRRGRPA